MRQSRFEKRRSKKSYILFGSIISVIVVLAIIIGAVIVNNQKSLTKSNSVEKTPVTQQNAEDQTDQTDKIVPTDENDINKVTLPEVEVDEDGYAIVQGEIAEPTYVEGILIANKKYPLPNTYNPGEDPKALEALDKLILGAKEAGFNIVAFSSFRSYEYQTQLYNNYVKRDGKKNADRYSARPGHSEHQTGLAFDIGEKGKEDLWLSSAFGETGAGKWLADNAHNYGFILRYPKGKEHITGFMHESWHFRYVGEDVAKEIYNSNVTLEEYLGID